MLAACTELKNAETLRQHLVSKKAVHQGFLPIKELGFIYFPLAKRLPVPRGKVVNVSFAFPEKEKSASVEELLRNELSSREMKLLPRAQEIVGTIMVLEIPEALQKYEHAIAQAYLKANKSIRTVVKKARMHEGPFRLRKVTVLAGRSIKETIHRENGIRLKLDLEKTYFSARLAHERLRIAQQVAKGEDVLVMFSGAAPYPLVIAKNSEASRITGIEINPLAHQYGQENVTMNKFTKRIDLKLGDVRDLLPKMRRKFDRIAMPLPKTGEEFLDIALPAVKTGGVIHLYAFLREEEIAGYRKNVLGICKKLGNSAKILRVVQCGQFAPGVSRYCVDMKVS